MAQTTTRDAIAEYLEAHPRMMGALFTAGIVLMHAGNVAANAGTSNNGP